MLTGRAWLCVAGLEFVKAMWGCLYAGIVAVPVCPPDPTRLAQTLPHFNKIVEDSGAVALLTDRQYSMVCPVALLLVMCCLW